MSSLSFWSSVARSIPTNRIPLNKIKWYFIDNVATLFKDPDTSFIFNMKYPSLKWSASGYPDSLTRHLLFEGYYQLDVLTFLHEYLKPGNTFIDVGGHHGLMAVTGAAVVGDEGKVITFEPNHYACKFIELHLKINNLKNVKIESIGLSNQIGETSFYIQKGDVTWNSSIIEEFVDVNSSTSVEKISIKLDTLDNYIATNKLRPEVIKIDVEGAEFLILEGAVKTLKEIRPVISMEFNPVSAGAAKSTVENYKNLLENEGYVLKVLKKNLFGYFSIFNHEPFNPAIHCSEARLSNVLCIPKEKMKDFER